MLPESASHSQPPFTQAGQALGTQLPVPSSWKQGAQVQTPVVTSQVPLPLQTLPVPVVGSMPGQALSQAGPHQPLAQTHWLLLTWRVVSCAKAMSEPVQV